MTQYIPIRRTGCVLFEYDPIRSLIRIKRGKDMHLVDLEAEAAIKVTCDHKNAVSARNEVIKSGLYCPDCSAILPETVGAEKRPFTKDEAVAAVKKVAGR